MDRVRSRTGHGLTDLAATRHMYRDFAGADIAPNHRITSTADPAHIASTIFGLVHAAQCLPVLPALQFTTLGDGAGRGGW